jgi:hypothetical protein
MTFYLTIHKLKELFKTNLWVSVGVSFLVGFAFPISLGYTFNMVFAQTALELEQFDPNIYPVIDLRHNPPLIAHLDEKVKLEFSTVCGNFQKVSPCCQPSATVFVAYGNEVQFTPFSLGEEQHDSLRVLSVEVPVKDGNGQPLRYYVQVNDPQTGFEVRYPTAGAIDIFVFDKFISVKLAVQPPTISGELVLALPWGSGSEEVGLRDREGYPAREGPLAMDVAWDGRIALLDHVNERVLIYNPTQKVSSIISLPFSLHSQGNIHFNREGQAAVFDPVGEPIGQSLVNIPQLYLFDSDGRLRVTAPVFVRIPAWMTKDLEILDLSYSKLVVPVNSSGEVNPREIQQQILPAKLLVKYMTDTVYAARFADVEKRVAYEVRSASPLGAIIFFEEVPRGYLAILEGDLFRAVWFDPSGKILKDISLPRNDYSEINSLGRFASDENGSLYMLGAVNTGIEVRLFKTP